MGENGTVDENGIMGENGIQQWVKMVYSNEG